MESLIIRQLLTAIALSVYIGSGARRLGYSGFVWGMVALLGGPIFALALLPSLPNRTLERARREERARLQQELAHAERRREADQAPVPQRTIGDERTVRE